MRLCLAILTVAIFVGHSGLASGADEVEFQNQFCRLSSAPSSRFIMLTEFGLASRGANGGQTMTRWVIACRGGEVGAIALDSSDRPFLVCAPGGVVAVDKSNPGRLVVCTNASLRLTVGRGNAEPFAILPDNSGHEVHFDVSGLVSHIAASSGVKLFSKSELGVAFGQTDGGDLLRVGFRPKSSPAFPAYCFFDGSRQSGRLTTFFQLLEFESDMLPQQEMQRGTARRQWKMSVSRTVDSPEREASNPLESSFDWLDTDKRYLEASSVLWDCWPFRSQTQAELMEQCSAAAEAEWEPEIQHRPRSGISLARTFVNAAYPKLAYFGRTSFSERCRLAAVSRASFRHNLEVCVGRTRLSELVNRINRVSLDATDETIRRAALSLLFRVGLTIPECDVLNRAKKDWNIEDRAMLAAICLVSGYPSGFDEQVLLQSATNTSEFSTASAILESLVLMGSEPPKTIIKQVFSSASKLDDDAERSRLLALVMNTVFGRTLVADAIAADSDHAVPEPHLLLLFAEFAQNSLKEQDEPLRQRMRRRCQDICLDARRPFADRESAVSILKSATSSQQELEAIIKKLWDAPGTKSQELALKLRRNLTSGKWTDSDWRMVSEALRSKNVEIRREAVLAAMYAVIVSDRKESLSNREKAYSILEVALTDNSKDVRQATLGVLVIFSRRGISLPGRFLNSLSRAMSMDESTDFVQVAAFIAHELSPNLVSWPPFSDTYPRQPLQWEQEWWNEHSSDIRQDLLRVLLQQMRNSQ
jgi:hypothetical protein